MNTHPSFHPTLPTPVMELNFNHFLVKVPEGMEHETVHAGFLMHLTESETTARQDIEEALERLERDENDCWLEHPGPYDEVIDLSSPESPGLRGQETHSAFWARPPRH